MFLCDNHWKYLSFLFVLRVCFSVENVSNNIDNIESTNIENVILPYKTTQSEVSAKTIRMGSTKWTSNYFFENFVSV